MLQTCKKKLLSLDRMVTLMQCIHDTVYTLEHPCYATLSLSQFLQLG